MRPSTLILALAAAAVQGQTTTSAANASASTTATSTTNAPVTHTVDVAKGGHSYSPDVVLAAVGDTIQFNFYPQNHSVIRAAYEYPCVPYEMVEGVGYTGFDSGFMPVDAVLDEPPTWSLLINDTDPIFYYCGAPNSCIGYQMVGVINPSANTSLSKQKQLAGESTFMLLPGEDWPNEGSVPSGVTYTPTTAASTAATTVTATPTTAAHSSHSALSSGAIAGIAIGGAVVLVAAGVAVWFCGRQSRARAAQQPMAPAQEVYPGTYQPAVGGMVSKPGHMSQMSGYTMPPGYENQPFMAQQAMRSPTMQTLGSPADPMMVHPSASPPPHMMMMHSGSPSPAPAPAYGQAPGPNMYAPGTHHVAPVEMDSAVGDTRRTSVEKQGVERYQ